MKTNIKRPRISGLVAWLSVSNHIMRLCFFLLLSAVCSALAAPGPMDFEKDQNAILQQGPSQGDGSQAETSAILRNDHFTVEAGGYFLEVFKKFRDMIMQDHVDYQSFEEKESPKIWKRLEEIQELVEQKAPERFCVEEFEAASLLHSTMKTGVELKNYFGDCNFPGEDSLFQALDANLKALCMFQLQRFDEPRYYDYGKKIAKLEGIIGSLEIGGRTGIHPELEKLIVKETEQARDSLTFVVEYNKKEHAF